jgi:hypothetical protein
MNWESKKDKIIKGNKNFRGLIIKGLNVQKKKKKHKYEMVFLS